MTDLLVPPVEIEDDDDHGILISRKRIIEITGYRTASKQVASLRKHGFTRARVNAKGKVILERAHYDAVCTGQAHRMGGHSTQTQTSDYVRHKQAIRTGATK